MNLLIICSRFPYPLEKGDKLRMFHQIKELSKYHNITLVSVSDESRSQSDKDQLTPYVSYQYHFDITSGVRLWNRIKSIFNTLPIQVSQLYDQSIMKAIRKIVNRHHIEHVYCQLPRAAEYARKLDLPKTIDYMDAFGESMSKRAAIQSGFWKKIYTAEASKMRIYESKIFVEFDHHTLISEQDKQYMDISNPDLIHVIPNGIDLEAFSFGLNPNPKSTLAFIGNMGYPPNEAAATYICKNIMPLLNENTTLRISGARPTQRVLSLRNNNVEVEGWLDNITDAYRSSSIFVVPMFSGTGQQNKILESMAVGMPCITTTIVNNAIGATPNKEILLADTPEEFAKAIQTLLKDKEFYQNIQLNARKFVEDKYSWHEHVSKLNLILSN